MSIANLTPPFPDLPDGYVITQAEWNGQFNSIFNYANGTIKPAIDALQSAPPPAVGAQSFFNARMTLESGVPVPTIDQFAKTTMYLTPYMGNLIGLYDEPTSTWSNYTFSELGIPIPAGARQLFDLFVRQTGGVCSLEIGSYQTQAATNSPAAGNSVVISMVSTANFAIGDIISVNSVGGSEECLITSLVTNTSITVDWLEFSHTTPTICSNVPVNALAMQDGILVKASDHSRRYCGTWLNGASGQANDARNLRTVGNANNLVQRPFSILPGVASWTTSQTSYFPLGGTKTGYRLVAVTADSTHVSVAGIHGRSATQQCGIATVFDANAAAGPGSNPCTVMNVASDEDEQGYTHAFSYATKVRGRHFLDAIGYNPTANKTFLNQSTFGGATWLIGYLNGTIDN